MKVIVTPHLHRVSPDVRDKYLSQVNVLNEHPRYIKISRALQAMTFGRPLDEVPTFDAPLYVEQAHALMDKDIRDAIVGLLVE